MRPRPLATGLLLAAATALSLAACASSPGASRPPSTATRTMPPGCPNVEGGVCVGELAAGRSYTTIEFHPRVTYSVPSSGWRNEEDLPGNFLLVPPGNTLTGVNAATSDFIGVYSSVAPARFAHPPSCAFTRIAGVASTPEAVARSFQHLDGVAASAPAPVTLGGLRGVRIDLRLRAGATVPHCTDDESGARVEVLPLTVGLDHSSFEHGLIPGETWRQILLANGDAVLDIEIDDVDAAPGTLGSLTAVAERLHFGS